MEVCSTEEGGKAWEKVYCHGACVLEMMKRSGATLGSHRAARHVSVMAMDELEQDQL